MALWGSKKKDARVLIVEDDGILRRILEKQIRKEISSVESLVDGLVVIEKVISYKPHVILLDMILPGIGGFEILRQLKTSDETKDIPVVILSNIASPADMSSAYAMGAEHYFTKANTRIQDVVSKIRKLVKNAKN